MIISLILMCLVAMCAIRVGILLVHTAMLWTASACFLSAAVAINLISWWVWHIVVSNIDDNKKP